MLQVTQLHEHLEAREWAFCINPTAHGSTIRSTILRRLYIHKSTTKFNGGFDVGRRGFQGTTMKRVKGGTGPTTIEVVTS